MGLDMYLHADRHTTGGNRWSDDDKRPMHNGWRQESSTYEVAYWRKFAPLHSFIVATFADGVDECQSIHLNANRCIQVAVALDDKFATFMEDNEVGGFFFGSPEQWAEDLKDTQDDAATFRKLAKWIDCGEKASLAEWRSADYRASW